MPVRKSGVAVAIVAAFLLSVAVAMAQNAGGVSLRGNTNIDVHAKDVNTVAVGSGNTAVTNIGTVDQNNGGHKNVTVDVQNVENIVGGANRKGCISIAGAPCK